MRAEPIFATASFVRRWLLIEQPGSWGTNALLQSRMPLPVATELRARAKAAGVRIILIRRGVRLTSEKRQCYFIRTERDDLYQTRLEVDTIHDLLDIDLSALRDKRTIPGAHEHLDPVFLVCTHGRHDACCSIRGNLVSRIACAQQGRDAWECSHIGGDRFAANLVCFPHGVYYGRVGSRDVVPLMDDYASGTLSLEHYRGRSCYPFAVQAAEYFVRRELSVARVDALALLQAARTEDRVAASFSVDHRRADVEIRVTWSEPQRLTCTARVPSPIPQYELLSCTAEPRG